MRANRSELVYGLLGILLLAGGVSSLAAQGRPNAESPNWTVSAMGGLLDFDFAEEAFGMFAVRGDFPLSKWARFEAETSLARVEVQTDDEGFFDPAAQKENSSLATVSIGIQARYRTRFVEPYIGVAIGLFFRRDDDGDGVRSNQSTYGVPAGLRFFLTDHIGLRTEVRVRRDQLAFGLGTDTNWEKTVGISWTF